MRLTPEQRREVGEARKSQRQNEKETRSPAGIKVQLPVKDETILHSSAATLLLISDISRQRNGISCYS